MVAFLKEALLRRAKENKAPAQNWELITHALLGMWLRVGLRFVFAKNVSREDALQTLTQLTFGALDAVL